MINIKLTREYSILFYFPLILFFSSIKAQTINPKNRVKKELSIIKHNEISTSMKMQSSLFNFSSETSASTSIAYTISNTTIQGATAEAKVLKTKVSTTNSMGKATHYDSDNPQAGDSKAAEQFNGLAGDVTKFKIDTNAIVIDVTRESKTPIVQKSNEYNSMIVGRVLDIFLSVYKVQHVGNSWADSIKNEKVGKIVDKYTYKSFEKGIATIEVNSATTMSQKLEGTDDEVDKEFSVTFTTLSILQVDINTLLIKKKKSTTTFINTLGVKENATTTTSITNTVETIE